MKKRLSLILCVIMVAAVFTLIFAAMALPVSAATEAGDSEVVVTVYWNAEDNFAAVPAENKIEVTKAELLTKLLGNSSENVTKAKAEAGYYIWLVFAADKQISLERNGQGIGFYVAKDKKTYVEGNGSVYRFNMDGSYNNGNNSFVVNGVGTGTNPGIAVISDFTVNSKNDAALNPSNCTVELDNVVLNSSAHKGVNVLAGSAKIVLDGVSTVYGGQHTMQVTSSNQLEVTGPFNGNLFTLSVSGDAGKATLNGVTLNGRLNVSYLKGTVEIKDTTITSYSAVSCTQKDSGPREIIISGSSVISSDADTNVVTIPAGVTVTLRDSAIIRSTYATAYPAAVSNSGTLNVEGGRIEANRFAVRMYASSTTNISGGTVTSPCDGLLRFEGEGATLNISGGTVENTYDGARCVINTNGKSNVSINITGGTVNSNGGNVIYANGGTNLDIDISGTGALETTVGQNAIQRIDSSATGATASFTMTGGSVTGAINFSTTNTSVNITGGSLTQSATLDLTALVGTLENFSNVTVTGTLTATNGTIVADEVTVTLTADEITLEGGAINGGLNLSGDIDLTLDGVTLTGMLTVANSGDVVINNTNITNSSGGVLYYSNTQPAGTRTVTVGGSSVLESSANCNVVTIPAGETLTLKDTAIIRCTWTTDYPAAVYNYGTFNVEGGRIEIQRFTAVRMGASSVTNIKGGTISATPDSFIRFDGDGATLNISGGTLENTGTGAVINTNTKNNITINITGGTVRTGGGNCIYANGGTGLAIAISGDAVLETPATDAKKAAIQRQGGASATGSFTVTGGTIRGGLHFSGTNTVINITGGNFYGQYYFQSVSAEAVNISNATFERVNVNSDWNMMEFGAATVVIDNCTLTSSGNCHVITTSGNLTITGGTRISVSDSTICVRGYAGSTVAIEGDCVITGASASEGATPASGVVEFKGTTLTIAEGAEISATTGCTVYIAEGSTLVSSGDISSVSGHALFVVGTASLNGGSITTGSMTLDLTTMTGTVEEFSNVTVTGTLTATNGTIVADEVTVTLTADEITLEGGAINGGLNLSGDIDLTLDGVTLTGKLTVANSGDVVINNTNITNSSGGALDYSNTQPAGTRTVTVGGSSVLESSANCNVVTIPAGETLTLKDTAIIRCTHAVEQTYPAAVYNYGTFNVEGGRIEIQRFAAVRMGASSVTNIKGGTISATPDSFIRFDGDGATLNISGGTLENTGTGAIINTNAKNNITINITGGTLTAGGNCIYANGGTGLAIDISNATLETTSTAGKNVIQRNTPSASDTTTITGSTVTGGGLAVAGTLTIDNTTVNSGTNTDAITFSGTTLDITNGSTITAGENKYTIKINSAAEVTIDGGSVVTSASVGDRVSDTKTVGHIIFGTNGITLNISGEGTIVEGTSPTFVSNTAGGVIDINRMSNATINIEDGATLRSKATTCIYNLGAAGTKVHINISGNGTLIQAGDNGDKIAVLMRQEFATEGEFNMTGGTVNGCISMSVNTKIKINVTGGAINGQLNLQQTANANKAIFKDVTITYVASGGSNTIDLANLPAEFENCTINASGGSHAITTKGELTLKGTTTINVTGNTIAVWGRTGSTVSIEGACVLTGAARGAGETPTSGTIDIGDGATVTIDAGATVSATSGCAVYVGEGAALECSGNLSSASGLALYVAGTASLNGGSITTGSMTLDLTTMTGTVEEFSNVAVTGSLKATQGTLTANAAKVTLTANKIALEDGSISAIAPGSGVDLDMTNTDSSVGFSLTDGDLTISGSEIVGNITLNGTAKLSITGADINGIMSLKNTNSDEMIIKDSKIWMQGDADVNVLSCSNTSAVLTIDNSQIISDTPADTPIIFKGVTLKVTNGSLIDSKQGGFSIRLQSSATATIDGGSTVRSSRDSHIYFEASDITLNISGQGTLVENTGTGAAINANGQNGGAINITDGATVRAGGGVCIYANGGTADISVSGDAVLETGVTTNAITVGSNTTSATVTINGADITGSIGIASNTKLSITDAQIKGKMLLNNTNSDEMLIKDSRVWVEGDYDVNVMECNNVNAVLTIDNSQIVSNTLADRAIIFKGTSLTITNGSLVMSENTYDGGAEGIALQINGTSSVVTVNGGSRVSSTVDGVVRVAAGCTLNISGEGTVIECTGATTASAISTQGTLNISGGSVTTTGGNCVYFNADGTVAITVSGDAVLNAASQSNFAIRRGAGSNLGTITVTGGEFTGGIDLNGTNTALSISNAEINGRFILNNTCTDPINITGATLTFDGTNTMIACSGAAGGINFTDTTATYNNSASNMIEGSTATIVIDGGTITSMGTRSNVINSSGSLTVRNEAKLDASGGGTAINLSGSGTLSVNGAQIRGAVNLNSSNSEEILIKDSTIWIEGNLDQNVINCTNANAVLTIDNCDITSNTPGDVPLVFKGATLTVKGGSELVSLQNGTGLRINGTASTVNITDGTVSSAIDGVVTVAAGCTLNISGADTNIVCTSGKQALTVAGNANITDAVIDGDIVLSGAATLGIDGATVNGRLNLNTTTAETILIKDATITYDSSANNMIEARGATVVIDGGTLTSEGSYSNVINTSGELTVQGNAQLIATGGGNAIFVNGANVTVTGTASLVSNGNVIVIAGTSADGYVELLAGAEARTEDIAKYVILINSGAVRNTVDVNGAHLTGLIADASGVTGEDRNRILLNAGRLDTSMSMALIHSIVESIHQDFVIETSSSDPYFIVTIPATITLTGSNDSFDISAELWDFGDKTLTVSVASENGFILINRAAPLDAPQIVYEVLDANGQAVAVSGGEIARFAGDTSGTQNVSLDINMITDISSSGYAGEWTDALTFTADIRDLVSGDWFGDSNDQSNGFSDPY